MPDQDGINRQGFEIDNMTLELDTIEYVGFGKRFLAGIIDMAILLPISIPIGVQIMKFCFKYRVIFPGLFYNLFITALFVFFVVKFGGTPGKLLLNVRIVSKGGTFLSVRAAILRMTFMLIAVVCVWLRIHHIFATMPLSENPQRFGEMIRATNSYGGIHNTINSFAGLLFYIDILVILFNKKRQAIHDFMASSYVISKKSYFQVNEIRGK